MNESNPEIGKSKVLNQLGVWSNVNLEAYKAAILISEKKHDDVISESESMTTKSISMITALFVFSGSISGYLLSHPEKLEHNITLVSIQALLLTITIGYLISLVLPRDIYGKGMSPQKTIPIRIDAETNKDHQLHMIYLNYLVFLQQAFDFNSDLVKTRACRYGISIVLFSFTMLFFIITSVYIIA